MVKINQNSSNTKKRSKVKKTRKCNNKQRGGSSRQAHNINNTPPRPYKRPSLTHRLMPELFNTPPRPYKRPSITNELMPELFNNSRLPRLSQRRSRNSEKKPIIVFDFDLTFIDDHSGGIPITKRTKNLSQATTNKYIEYLTNIKTKFSKIYINSRGVIPEEIQQYFVNNGIDEYIDDFYGADSNAEISKTRNNNITNTSNSTSYWSKRKVRNLNDILLYNPGYRKNDIYFYDDTELNIKEARKSGYVNSYVVPSPNPNPNSVSHLYPQLKGGEKLLAKIASGDFIIQGSYELNENNA